MALLLRFIPVRLQPVVNRCQMCFQNRIDLALPLLVALVLTLQRPFDRVPRMARLPGYLTNRLAVNPMGRPDVFVLIHLQHAPFPSASSGVNRSTTLTENAGGRPILRYHNIPGWGSFRLA
jgi:hypothetical protein